MTCTLTVKIQIDIGQIWRRSPVDDNLIEDKQICGWSSRCSGGAVARRVFLHYDATETAAKGQGRVT